VSIAISGLLLLISHLADWQMQCEQHGWKGYLWTRGKRALRGPWWAEWFPRDAWHWLQIARNWGALSACMVLLTYWPYPYWAAPVGFVALYAITRGAGFSLPRKLTQGY
jgi:hypothetical protein